MSGEYGTGQRHKWLNWTLFVWRRWHRSETQRVKLDAFRLEGIAQVRDIKG